MGWIESYLQYTEQQVSPRIFHFWSAVAVLGAVLERKVILRVGEDRWIWPGQIMVVLVSKSAVTKKTSAASLAVKLLRKLEQKEPWTVYVLPRKLSPQQLLMCLQRLDPSQEGKKEPLVGPNGQRVNSAGFIFAGELGTMFTTEPFAEALATHINDLNEADTGFTKYEFRSWQAELWNATVGMLGCITPKGLARELPKTARTAGFFGRLLIVHASYTDRAVALLETISDKTKELREELVKELGEIGHMHGKYRITKEAREWEVEWYHKTYLPWLGKQDFPENEQSGYWQRKESHMLRVGMVLAASESRELVLKREHLELALKRLEEMEREMPHAFSEMHANPYHDFDLNLLTALEQFGGTGWVPEPRLRRAMINSKQGGDRRFIESRDTLRAAGEIEIRRMEGETEWRRVYSSGRLLRGTKEGRDGDKAK